MKNVQVRNVPEKVHKVLRKRAAEAGQSLQEYLLQLLKESAGQLTVKEVFDRVRRMGGGITDPSFDSAKLIREIRDERDEQLWHVSKRTPPDRR
ncbi:MAG: FitA-like ribbon-helix-helix domain-containing protein [Actinomycetota bacterium]